MYTLADNAIRFGPKLDLGHRPPNHACWGRNTVDSDSEDENLLAAPQSWTVEFERYIQTAEAVAKDVDIVDWWGVSDHILFGNHHVIDSLCL